MRRRVAAAGGLCAVYVLALGRFAPADVVTGLAVGACVVALMHRALPPATPDPRPPVLARLVALVPFLLAVVADITAGTLRVASALLRLHPRVEPGVVAVPIDERTPTGVAVHALVTTLSPGSVLVDVDRERKVMLFQVLDASDPDAVRAQHRRLYERFQRAVFP